MAEHRIYSIILSYLISTCMNEAMWVYCVDMAYNVVVADISNKSLN